MQEMTITGDVFLPRSILHRLRGSDTHQASHNVKTTQQKSTSVSDVHVIASKHIGEKKKTSYAEVPQEQNQPKLDCEFRNASRLRGTRRHFLKCKGVFFLFQEAVILPW